MKIGNLHLAGFPCQWNRLLDAVSIDRELQGEFMGPGAAGRMSAKWEQLAANLNSMGGAFKTGDKWKEAYCNLRNRAKRQYADRSRYMRATGGGPPPPASLGLGPVYQRVLAHVPLQHVIGHPQVPAPLQQQAGFVPQPVQQVVPQNQAQQQPQVVQHVLIDLDQPSSSSEIGFNSRILIP
ncbi:uncharacterized protein LOC113214935 [Frankliniella occidentalis]|uniref:Regulatory protein zeste n=1 Tax=Frankliniella occidentalis TaxID=133901 RepID=A0A9C6WZJ8_FRAOC|nr:uncharacterized protein LOC113214935 [Frankliniella occidentalis]